MLNSTTLEVAIGMALVYLLVSFLCTSINEAIAGLLGSRARNLEAGVRALFSEGTITHPCKPGETTTLTEALYNHGLVQSLYRSGKGAGVSEWYNTPGTKKWFLLGWKLPSYIPSRTFAAALFEIVFPEIDAEPVVTTTPQAAQDDTAAANPVAARTEAAKAAAAVRALQRARMVAALEKLPASKAREALLTLVKQANGDLERTRTLFEHWYDDAMDRVSGWYKHRTQVVLFTLGLLVSIAINIDSVAVGRALWNTPAVRAYAMKAAEKYANDQEAQASTPTVATSNAGWLSADCKTARDEAAKKATDPGAPEDGGLREECKSPQEHVKELESLTIPIGWNLDHWRTTPNWHRNWPMTILGWLLTAFAVMLGSPFWFDVLNRFMVVRSTVKPQEKSGPEGGKEPSAS